MNMDEQPEVDTREEVFKPDKKWFQTWKIIYPILGIVAVLELIFGIKTLLAPLPKSQSQKLQSISDARIVLVSAKSSYKVGESIPIKVRVVTSGHITSGTDLVLRFDPKLIEASPTSFARGKIYNDYPQVSIDSKAGVIRISGVSSTKKVGFIGVGELGTVTLKAKAGGTTMLTVDFKKGLTNDSNVIDASDSKDVLGIVYNLKLTIN